jgi:hypothetical protein
VAMASTPADGAPTGTAFAIFIAASFPHPLDVAKCSHGRRVRKTVTSSRGWVGYPDAVTPARLQRRFMDQLVDVLARATTEVFDVEPPYRPDRLLVPLHVQAEVRRKRILPRDDVVLAGFDDLAAARTLVDDGGRLGHRHQSSTHLRAAASK